MYYYVFESFGPNDKRTIVNEQIKDNLNELGIAGEISAPSLSKNVDQILLDAIEKKYSTIVAVGNIQHITHIASRLAGTDIVMGMVPLENYPSLNTLINVNNWKEAVTSLRFRLFIEARLGVIDPGGHVFLSYCEIKLRNLKSGYFQFPLYQVNFTGQTITVKLNDNGNLLNFEITDAPRRAIFNFLIKKEKFIRPISRFSEKKGFLKIDPIQNILIEGKEIANTPVTFSLSDKKLKIIIAKSLNA